MSRTVFLRKELNRSATSSPASLPAQGVPQISVSTFGDFCSSMDVWIVGSDWSSNDSVNECFPFGMALIMASFGVSRWVTAFPD